MTATKGKACSTVSTYYSTRIMRRSEQRSVCLPLQYLIGTRIYMTYSESLLKDTLNNYRKLHSLCWTNFVVPMVIQFYLLKTKTCPAVKLSQKLLVLKCPLIRGSTI